MTQPASQRKDGARVAIIGVGTIGSNVAFQVYNKLGKKELVEDIILIGRNEEKVACAAEEIHHSNDGSISTRLKHSTVVDSAAGCDIIVYSAGRTIKPHETREDLLRENGSIAADVRKGLSLKGTEIFITVTNPVDVLNTYFSRELGLPANNVIGLGGMLDSARFRHTVVDYLRRALGVPLVPSDVKNAFVLGQHGAGLTPLFERLELPPDIPVLSSRAIEKIRKEMGEIVPRIIRVRKCADFAPATHITRMIELLLQDTESKIECCSLVPPMVFQKHYAGEVLDVSFGVPVTLKRGGARPITIDILEDSRQRISNGVRDIWSNVQQLYDYVVGNERVGNLIRLGT
ncbi:MAG: hypothetical protein Q7T16_03120 [Candidatus Burarchaeum sp.]|nr:hypothetical protein [Candidatus Burarchaeum sp.]MDO8339624.1 hypothetical protein [Candidatus Burarchaeum sp.]